MGSTDPTKLRICDHAKEFAKKLRAATEQHYVSIDEPYTLHCHVCSDVYSIKPNDWRTEAVKLLDGFKAPGNA